MYYSTHYKLFNCAFERSNKYWSCPCQPVIYVLHPAVCCCPQVEETILCWFPTIRWLPKRNPKTEKKHKTFSSSSRSTVTQCPGRKWALHFTHRLEVLYNHSLYELNSSISCDICWRVCVTSISSGFAFTSLGNVMWVLTARYKFSRHKTFRTFLGS